MTSIPPRACGRRLGLPAWAWGALSLALAWTYLRGMSTDPLRWEEPRRALVAMEMLHRGDYVVPRLLGEPYLNKPPLHSWTIAILAGGEPRRVGPLAVRLPSLLAVLGVALVLWRLGFSSVSGPHALPALVFLTFGILPQYGRPGEIDLFFTFWVTAALAAFEWGRRSASPILQWVVSQGLAAAGVLTKGLAPVFVHLPILLFAWRRRPQVSWRPRAFTAGIAVLLLIVAAWLLPYAATGPILALRDRLGSEVAQRTVEPGPLGVARHLALYPFILVGAAAPWSLFLLALRHRGARAALAGLTADPWVALAATVVLTGVLVFAFVPGTVPRYLIPVLPCAAVAQAAALLRVDRPWRASAPWFAFAAAWLLAVPLLARYWLGALPSHEAASLAGVALVLGLGVVAAGRALAARGFAITAAFLTAGLLYGLGYGGLLEARTAERNRAFERAARVLAPRVRREAPLVVREGTDRKLTYPLAHALDRVVCERPPGTSYDLVGEADVAPPEGATLVATAGRFALWRVRPPVAAP